MDRRHITVEGVYAKNKTARRIPINSELFDLFLGLQRSGSEYVFLNGQGKPYNSPTGIRAIFVSTCKHANIEGLRFHDLRHTVATRLVDSGVPSQRIAKYLGHKDVNMTYRTYSHPEQSLHDDAEFLVINHNKIITTSNSP